MKTIRNIALSLVALFGAAFIVPLFLMMAKLMPVETMATIFSFYVTQGFGAVFLLLFIVAGLAECLDR